LPILCGLRFRDPDYACRARRGTVADADLRMTLSSVFFVDFVASFLESVTFVPSPQAR